MLALFLDLVKVAPFRSGFRFGLFDTFGLSLFDHSSGVGVLFLEVVALDAVGFQPVDLGVHGGDGHHGVGHC